MGKKYKKHAFDKKKSITFKLVYRSSDDPNVNEDNKDVRVF
jgi:hypothetical protein